MDIYRYNMDTNVVIIVSSICYKSEALLPKYNKFFSDKPLIIRTNQPIREGDWVNPSCCLDTALKDDFIRNYLFDENEELDKDYGVDFVHYATRIDSIRLEFVNEENEINGHGGCTFFASLIPSNLYGAVIDLRKSIDSSINQQMRAETYKKIWSHDTLPAWQERIPQWDSKFTCLGLANELMN